MKQTLTIHQSLLGLVGIHTDATLVQDKLDANRDGFSHAKELWVGHGPERLAFVAQSLIANGVAEADSVVYSYITWLLSAARDDERASYSLDDAVLAHQCIKALDASMLADVLRNPVGGLRVKLNLLAIKAGKRKERTKKTVDFASEAKTIRAHQAKLASLMATAVGNGDFDSVVAIEAHVEAQERSVAMQRRFLDAAKAASLTIPAVPGDLTAETVSA